MERCTSRKNPTIKEHSKLRTSAGYRKETGLFFCEGARLCMEAAQSGTQILVCYVTESAQSKYATYLAPVLQQAEKAVEITEEIAQLLSDTKQPQGVFCVCKMPVKRQWTLITAQGHYLGLEHLQDPGNLGTALRTAEALGVAGVVLTEDCCDLYSPKVLRSAMGAVFRVPCYEVESMAKAGLQFAKNGFQTLAAVVQPTATPITKVDFSQPTFLVVGNEGNGLREATVQAMKQAVTIPMAGRGESLNASSATAILLWEMLRGGKANG